MSFEWSSQPLTIQSIASQYTLPVAIRTAPGFRGSNRPIVLHSVSRLKFGFGRALTLTQTTTTNENGTYKPSDSEIVAIPLKYPGYFECLSSRDNNGQPTGIIPETSVRPIVERMQIDQRPQAFYIASPMRVYTIETTPTGITNRIWHQIEPHQMILFDKLVYVEYTPTLDDNLTDEDYMYSWWFCFGKQVLPRNEYAVQCILTQQQTCYIPCSSTDEVNLIPVGQRGSHNVNKLQMIYNLIEQFPIPINIKLYQLPGSYAYKDFSGSLQLLGSRSEEFAICASLTSTNIVVIPTNTPLKFVVSTLASTQQNKEILARCHILIQSFDMQIRRIIISSNHEPPSTTTRRTRTRFPKIQAAIDDQFKRFKRSYSVDQKLAVKDDQTTTTTDEGYRSSSAALKKRNKFSQQRSASVDVKESTSSVQNKRRSSTDDDPVYNSLVHPVRTKPKSSSLSPTPPALPEKPPNFPYPSTTSASDCGSNLIDDIDSSNADGAILMDASNELVLALPSDSRFT